MRYLTVGEVLYLNGYQISASVDEQIVINLGVASGSVGREASAAWRRGHIERS